VILETAHTMEGTEHSVNSTSGLSDITNHLATVFRVPGQKFFGWLLSGMAITNDLPSVFCWVSQMASSHIRGFISSLISCFISGLPAFGTEKNDGFHSVFSVVPNFSFLFRYS
jgi:hypothetical protein